MSVRPARRRLTPSSSRTKQQRLAAVVTGIFLTGTLAGALTLSVPPEKVSADAERPRAVIIVGPSSSSTSKYLDEGDLIADQAEDAGMHVTRIFHPQATWERVRPALRDANLVVYFGHGNGWPSPYAPFQENTKNGFGLNAYEGASSGSHIYYGGNVIRQRVRLATNAVVVLYRSCYASGNGEDSHLVPSKSVALERVDNFAAAFLHKDVRAGAVMAFGSQQMMDLPAQLMKPDQTMDDIFRTRSSEPGWRNSGWIGSDDFYADSDRTRGARMHLDPHPSDGYKRAITGDLELTTSEWLSEASEPEPEPSPDPSPSPSPDPDPSPDPSPDPEPGPDDGAPQLIDLSASATGSTTSDEGGPVTFSPDGDGTGDGILLTHHVSEPSWIDVSIADATGRTVRQLSHWSERKRGSSEWDGEDASGNPVPDGLYRIAVKARSAAGARSAPLDVEVHALVLLRGGSWDSVAVHGADGDTLARAAAFEAELLDDATARVRVQDADGDVVRTILPEAASAAGPLHVPWNGRGSGGDALPYGPYWAVASAETDLGKVRERAKIWVGPYRVKLSDRTPRRGQDIRITVTTTEPQGSSPRLTISQPGLRGYWWDTARVDSDTYRAYVKLKSGGQAGKVLLSVDGKDVGGQRDRYRTSFRIS